MKGLRLLRLVAEELGWLRPISLVLVYLLGFAALVSTESTAGPPLGPLAAAYQSLRFFVVDPWGMPTPSAGYGAVPFWIALFGGPFLTAEIVLSAWRKAIAAWKGETTLPPLTEPVVVVCGIGLHGRMVIRKALDLGCSVLAIDSNPSAGELQGMPGPTRFQFRRGDFTQDGVLQAAGVPVARAVWFCAGDPMMNLRGTHAAAKMSMSGELVPMVDEDLDSAFIIGRLPRRHVFPFFQFDRAARVLVQEKVVQAALHRIREAKQGRVAVVGFGRFGRAILARLLEVADVGRVEIVLVDREAPAKLAAWRADHVVRDGVALDSVKTDLEDWVVPKGLDLVFICTGTDLVNLRLAARVERSGPYVAVVLRLFDEDLVSGEHERVASKSLAALAAEDVAERMRGYVQKSG